MRIEQGEALESQEEFFERYQTFCKIRAALENIWIFLKLIGHVSECKLIGHVSK